MESKFIQIQFSFFLKNEISIPFEDISKKIKEIFGDDIISQVIGLPKDAPAEMPRIISNGKLGFGVDVFKNRINFFSEEFNFWEKAKEKVCELLKYLENNAVIRIGIAPKYFIENVSVEKLKDLLNDSFKDKALSEITLRLNTIIKNEDKDYNNIEIYEITSLNKDPSKKGLLISRDINNVVNQIDILVSDKINLENVINFALQESNKHLFSNESK